MDSNSPCLGLLFPYVPNLVNRHCPFVSLQFFNICILRITLNRIPSELLNTQDLSWGLYWRVILLNLNLISKTLRYYKNYYDHNSVIDVCTFLVISFPSLITPSKAQIIWLCWQKTNYNLLQVVLLNVYDVMIKAVMVVPRVETKLYSEWVSLNDF